MNGEFRSFSMAPTGLIKDIVNMEAKNGDTPLRFLFGSSHFDLNILQQFVSSGADVNKPNTLGRTPLHRVMMSENIGNRLHVCKILLDGGANTNLQDEFGLTPIFWSRTVKQVSLLCDTGAADVTHIDTFGRNALMNLTIPRTLETVEALAVRGCSVNSVDRNGSTSLHYAVWMNDINMVEQLLIVGGDFSFADEDNRTPLMLSEVLGYSKIYEILERHNLNICTKDVTGQKEHVEIVYQRDTFLSRKHWPGNQLTINHKDIANGDNIIDIVEMQQYNGSVLAKHLLTRPGSGKLFDNPETKRVIDTVQSLVKRLSDRISQRDPRFKNDIIPMGSMGEGTKTGYPEGFDFVCCLTDILKYCEIEPNDEGPQHEGFVRMKLREDPHLPIHMGSFFDCNGYFKTYDVRIELFRLIWNILQEKEMWKDRDVLYVGEDEENGFDRMPVLNFQISWIFRIFKGLTISIDFVPAIHVSATTADFYLRDNGRYPQEKTSLDAGLFMLLHPPDDIISKTIDIFEVEDTNWSRTETECDNVMYDLVKSRLRVSCAPMEVSFIDSLPNVIRESYILAKIIKSECPKVRFVTEFFKELYDRDPVKIQRHENVHFDPGEYDEYVATVRTINEASIRHARESSFDLDVRGNTEQTVDEKSLNTSDQSFSSGEDTGPPLAMEMSDDSEEQIEHVGFGPTKSVHTDVASRDSSPVDYLSDDTDNTDENEMTNPVYEAQNDITSYMLKNALFHLVGKYPELTDKDMDKNSDEERWKITVNLTIQIFEFLMTASDTGELPVYFMPRQNVLEFIYEFGRPLDQEELSRRIHSDGRRRKVFLNLILAILRAP